MAPKNNRKIHQQQKSAPPPPAGLPPVSQSATDRRQDRRISRAMITAVGSGVLSLVTCGVTIFSACAADRSAKEAQTANRLTREAQDRTAGKVAAKFIFVDEANRDPSRFKPFMRKKVGDDQLVFRIESADELLRWAPHVRIKNTGTEPIDAIRLEVAFDMGVAYGRGVQQIDPMPVSVHDPSSFEANSFGKLLPGQTAAVLVTPLLLGQIMRSPIQEFADQDHYGVFTVNAYCRLVGVTGFDAPSDNRPLRFQFHWRPPGFRSDAKRVKELLDTKPLVTIQ